MQIARSVTRPTVRALGVLVLGMFVAQHATAQMRAWEDTAYLSINFAYEASSRAFQEGLTESIYDETATYSAAHQIGGGGVFDISGGLRVWRNLAAGVAITSISTADGLLLEGQVPHPLFFNRFRTGRFARTDLEHKELGIHLQAVWVLPVTDSIQLSFFGGPSIFNVDQDSVTSATIAEVAPPFGEVSITQVSTVALGETAVGGNVGVDATYMVTDQFGGGLFVRWAGGTVDLADASGGPQSIDVGGMQTGAGLRVRF